MPTPEMRRLRYPHDLHPTITPLFCSSTTSVPVINLTFPNTLMVPSRLLPLSTDSQLPQRLYPLLVRISTREIVCVAVAYQHACRRLSYELLKRMLVRPGVECGEQPAWAQGVRYQNMCGTYVRW
jgi:hypothetical protein